MDKNQIKQLINNNNPIIFEIGCADGKDSQEFLNMFENISLYCFEPEPKNIEIIKQTINNKNHYLYEGVISNLNGKITFNRSRTDNPNDLSYSGSIKKPKEHLQYWPFIKFDQFIEVNSITLDKFCFDNNVNVIDFIWMDVQGAENDVIEGGKETFDNKVKFLYTEYSNNEYYEHQPNLNTLLDILGSNWVILKDFGTDILLKNTKL